MKAFANKVNSSILRVLTAALVLLLASCTKVDYSVGLGVVPSDQTMSVHFLTLSDGIETYLTQDDSVASSNLASLYLGKLETPDFGKSVASGVVQFEPLLRSDSLSEGINITADSMWLLVTPTTIKGDSMVRQYYNIFNMQENVFADSTYYTSFPYSDYINESEPMFSFSTRNTAKVGDYDTLRLKMENEGAARKFLEELATFDDELYADDSLFHNQFKGLYITPTESSPTDASLYSWSLEESEDAVLIYYGHNYDPEEPTSVLDTLVRMYSLCDQKAYTNNASITCVEHDYAGTEFESEISGELTTQASKTYLQSMGGVVTALKFNDDFIEQLRTILDDANDIMINRAAMYVYTADQTADSYDAAPTRMGTYYDYTTLHAIPDYAYAYESYSGKAINYGGYLNRSNGYYMMDISTFIQQLLDDDEADREVVLGSSAYSLFVPGAVALLGAGSENPIKVSITYTLINN